MTSPSWPDGSGFWSVAADLFQRLQDAGAALAVSNTVPEEVELAIKELVYALPESPESLGAADPYLVSALYAGAMHSLEALGGSDDHERRRDLRFPLERARQALRDLVSNEPVMDDKSVHQIVRWLVDSEEIPRRELARVLEISPTTLRRWADENTSSPRGTEARKLRMLAKVVNQLRWSFSPVGVIEWLQTPHPALKGDEPRTLLADAEGGLALLRLASGTRSMTLT